MFKHILIPTDGTEISERTLRQGLDFARETGAEVTLLTCSLPVRAFGAEALLDEKRYVAATAGLAKDRLDAGAQYARENGVKATLRHVYEEHPADAIVATAANQHCDLVIMASHGRRGLEGLLIGSETRKVLARSKLPVLVCR